VLNPQIDERQLRLEYQRPFDPIMACAYGSSVVFVHGLGGTPKGTWTYQKDPPAPPASPTASPLTAIETSQNRELCTNIEEQQDTRHTQDDEEEQRGQSNAATTIGQTNEPAAGREDTAPSPALDLRQETEASPKDSFFSKIFGSKRKSSKSSSRSKDKNKDKSRTRSKDESEKQKVDGQVSRGKEAKRVASDNDGFFWPQVLPDNCPTTRTMTFGYDSEVSKFFGGAANKNTFYDHAGNLLGELTRERANAVRVRITLCSLCTDSLHTARPSSCVCGSLTWRYVHLIAGHYHFA
jgi:hypothetical protein